MKRKLNSAAPVICLFTVGTGTAGKESNVAHGLINAVHLIMPAGFYLVPSQDPNSVAVAELVRDGICEKGLLNVFRPAREKDDFFRMSAPDDIQICHHEFREVIQCLTERHPGARLIINPTSGTKQMTSAAVLAALDLGVGEIQFISGERQDGVVRTGRERISAFSTRQFMADRAGREARELIRGGAYAQAARVAGAFLPELRMLANIADLFAAWDRMDYRTAYDLTAKQEGDLWRQLRQTLGKLQCEGRFSLARLGDLAAASERWLALGRPEDAIARLYRGLELAGKSVLQARYGMGEPYTTEKMPPTLPDRLVMDFRSRARKRDGKFTLGLRDVYDVLQAMNDPYGCAVSNDPMGSDLAAWRNDSIYGHGTLAIDVRKARQALEHFCEILAVHFEDFPRWRARCAFPAPERLEGEKETAE